MTSNNELASMIDALALHGDALAAFRQGWHDADAAGNEGGRVASGLLNVADWLRDTQPMAPEESERDGTLGEVIDRRVQVYGDPVIGFAEIATMWSVLFGVEIPAWKVPIAQLLMKVVRMKTSPDYSDHSDDIGGYLDIFRQIIGSDMIEARTVNDYILLKWGAES